MSESEKAFRKRWAGPNNDGPLKEYPDWTVWFDGWQAAMGHADVFLAAVEMQAISRLRDAKNAQNDYRAEHASGYLLAVRDIAAKLRGGMSDEKA